MELLGDPGAERAEARSSEVFLAELQELRRMWEELGVQGDPADYDTGCYTDELWQVVP
jgi:hypothetical protein